MIWEWLFICILGVSLYLIDFVCLGLCKDRRWIARDVSFLKKSAWLVSCFPSVFDRIHQQSWRLSFLGMLSFLRFFLYKHKRIPVVCSLLSSWKHCPGPCRHPRLSPAFLSLDLVDLERWSSFLDIWPHSLPLFSKEVDFKSACFFLPRLYFYYFFWFILLFFSCFFFSSFI